MAVAVKNASEAAPQSPLDRLRLSSLAGAAYVAGSIVLVFYALPWLWANKGFEVLNSFTDGAFLLMLTVGGVIGLTILGSRLQGAQPPEGMRAGVFTILATVVVTLFAMWAVGVLLESFLPAAVGVIVTLAVGVGLLFLAFRKFVQPGTEDTLIAFEHQGWFTWAPYKKSQGLRVRRGTILGILGLACAGIWRLWEHKSLVYGVAEGWNNWYVRLPFTEDQFVILLRDVRFTVPILFTVGAFWLAYRLVNFPAFADFLIATEAEMNKVSWTSRKRLVQDTMVVLVTVILMTVFLFVVDIVWGFLLTKVGVLKSSSAGAQQQVGQREQPW